jgi:spectinomycin phosphotransferase
VLIKPEISKEAILRVLRAFGLRKDHFSFLPSGDPNSTVYPVSADGVRYLLKLRCGDFQEIAATIATFLRSRGLLQVRSPLWGAAGRLWIHADAFDWMLYPWLEGKTGFLCPLSEPRWTELGATMRQVHTVAVPTKQAARVPRES